ncbi:LexA family protein [Liquorilactobacillus uvarum]|uniref:LexA family protein n=1 Tax=Liquorilactobacillus uvarum TaxID=303240 RepID=UPI00288A02B6|nr:XRE family transcriptional regulator [Liquorilactobacillus uvarum]
MELSKYVGSKIRELRESRGMDQDTLASKLKTTRVTISRYETGARKANQDVLFQLADIFKVSINYFFPTPQNLIPITKTIKIPLLGTIACGDPILAEENIESYVDEPTEDLPSGKLFYLKAKGNSMKPTIPNGSKVLIRLQSDVEDSEIAAVLMTEDNEATLKRVKRVNGTMFLMPDNPDFDPIIADKNNPARILGKAMRYTSDL